MEKLSGEDLGKHLKEIVPPEILAQINPSAMEQGLNGMAQALNTPSRGTTRGR